MTDQDQIQIAPAPADELAAASRKSQRNATASQIAAAVEAAYILEAVRK